MQGKEPDFVNEKFRDRTTMFYIAGKAEVKNSYEITGNSGIYVACEHKIAKIACNWSRTWLLPSVTAPDRDTYYLT